MKYFKTFENLTFNDLTPDFDNFVHGLTTCDYDKVVKNYKEGDVNKFIYLEGEDEITTLAYFIFKNINKNPKSNNYYFEEENKYEEYHKILDFLLTRPELDINLKNIHGNTCLFYVYDKITFQKLIEKVVNPFIENNYGKTMIDIYKYNVIFHMESSELTKELLDYATKYINDLMDENDMAIF